MFPIFSLVFLPSFSSFKMRETQAPAVTCTKCVYTYVVFFAMYQKKRSTDRSEEVVSYGISVVRTGKWSTTSQYVRTYERLYALIQHSHNQWWIVVPSTIIHTSDRSSINLYIWSARYVLTTSRYFRTDIILICTYIGSTVRRSSCCWVRAVQSAWYKDIVR